MGEITFRSKRINQSQVHVTVVKAGDKIGLIRPFMSGYRFYPRFSTTCVGGDFDSVEKAKEFVEKTYG